VPLVCRIEQDVLVIESNGAHTRQEMEAAVLGGIARPDASELKGVLVDLRNSRSILERSSKELHEAAAYYASHKDQIGGRVAIVAASDASYGLGRMASVTAEDLGLRVFVCRDLTQAWEFLLT
jgi:hypothetical protein